MMEPAFAVLFQLACAAAPAAEPTPIGPIDLSARQRAYKPYDGAGRYTMAKDDGVRSVQGLVALARRFGVKPYQELATGDGAWRSERVVFQDVDTAATVIRFTSDRFADQLSYFQGNWSADGQYAVFRRRPGMWEASTPTHGPMAVRADGTGLRNVFREYAMVRSEVCSPTDPNVCYAMAEGDKKVVAFDLATGKRIRVVREGSEGWHLKISPDGKYLMSRGETSKGKGLWIVGVDGKPSYEIAIPEPIHDSYCFHPTQKKVMFWYEGKFEEEGFVQCDFDGANRTKVNVKFDWNHGAFGLDRGVHCTGYMTRLEGNTWLAREPLFHAPGVESYDDPHDYNGYTSWRPRDRMWSYSTRSVHRPYLSEIQAFPAEPAEDSVVNRYRICYTALQRAQFLDAPNASPDGTKVLFNSNFLGSDNIFGVVARLPERPLRLTAERTPEGVELTWKAARHHAETAGYHVYRSRTGGLDFVPLTERPVNRLAFRDATAEAAEPCYYAVTAVEYSGLESGLSDEAWTGAPQTARRHVAIELERARLSPAMWLAFHGAASNLHYVWMRKAATEAAATLPLDRAQFAGANAVALWARVKGEQGAEFLISTGRDATTVKAPASADWTWVKAEARLDLGRAGELVVSSKLCGSAIDCLILTDDDATRPDQSPRIRAPAIEPPDGLAAEAISPYVVRLAWQPSGAATLHHYNVYCGESADFAPNQATLAASPDEPLVIDWGLEPGSTLHYRVSCVDRFGGESTPSPSTAVKTPAIRRLLIEKPFAEKVAFEVAAKDTYAVWLLLQKAGESHGYIDVACHRAGSGPVAGGGAWFAALDGLSDASWLNYDQWGRFDLDAGPHVLKIANKTGSKILKVVITNDLSYTPPGHINILTGW